MYEKINKEKFLDLYNQGLKDLEIAKQLNCTRTYINCFRRNLGLQINQLKVTQFQTELIVGSLLGDMSLYKPHRSPNNNNSYAGGFTHSIKQKDYFMFKYNKLNGLMGKLTYPINRRNGGEYQHISSYFLQGLHLKPFYDAFYNPKKKSTE